MKVVMLLTGLSDLAMLSFSYCGLYNRFCHRNPWQYPNLPAKEIPHDANVAVIDDVDWWLSGFDSCGGDNVGAAADRDAVKYVAVG